MFRKHLIAAVALLAFGITTLRCAANPVPIISSTPAIAHVVQTSVDFHPDSVRGFDVNTPVGMSLLDQRAEVMFDD